jgi:predicted MFS family arabinose efflux permease
VLLIQSLPGGTVASFEVLAFLVGVTMPPLHIASRVLYPRLLPPARLLRIYSWDVSLTQLTWIAVPAGLVAIQPIIGVASVYRLLAVFILIGVVAYCLTIRGIPPERLRTGAISLPKVTGEAPFRDPRLYVYLGAAASIMFVSGVVLPVLVSVSPSSGDKALSILVWSIGSSLGSILVNRRGIRRSRLVRNIAIAMGVGLATLLWLHAPAINVALLVLGFSTSPVTGAVFYFISQRYPARRQTFLFGLVTSVQLVAEGLGATLCGILIDRELFPAVGAAYFVPIAVLLLLVGRGARNAFVPTPIHDGTIHDGTPGSAPVTLQKGRE